MKSPVLTLRISRRAVGAVVLEGEAVAFRDGRYLRSNREAALKGMIRYVRMLLDLTKPGSVAVDCPRIEGSGTERLWTALTEIFKEQHFDVRPVTTGELLHAYGVTGLHSRMELRRVVEPFFPELVDFDGKVRPYVIEAAAVALYVESALALGDSPP